VWSDKESERDYLNFGEVSQLAVDILTTPGMLPVSIGVFGNWGAGKSSLLKFIQQQLAEQKTDHIAVYFDAWLYQGYDDARASILEVIARELTKAAGDNQNLIEKTKSLLARVDGFRALGWIAEGAALALGVPTGGLIARGIGSFGQVWNAFQETDDFTQADFQETQKVLSEGKKAATETVKKPSKATPPQQIDAFRKEFGEILEELGKPLIVTIDNLDRCLPANAIHTLEAIRLFLFMPNTAFVIAADEEMIRSTVAEYFKGTSERHHIDYLDKLIQVPIRVPKAGVREIRSYLFMLFASDHGLDDVALDVLRSKLEGSLQQSWQEEPITREEALATINASSNGDLIKAFELADRIAPILATSPIIHGNPRIVKRLLNVVKMRAKTANRRQMPLDEGIITKLVIFERCAGADATASLYRMIDAEDGKPETIRILEEQDDSVLPESAPQSWKQPTTKEFILEWSKLYPPLRDVDLRAAVYLSRETMPIGVYVIGLSPQGREALKVLANTRNISSPTGQGVVKSLALEEQVPVMEGLISQLRQVSDWSNQPDGFAGACLLAGSSVEAAVLLRRFINDITNKPIWMNSMVSDQAWFKET
jgi:predicted KAP-like P-loop ATPase